MAGHPASCLLPRDKESRCESVNVSKKIQAHLLPVDAFVHLFYIYVCGCKLRCTAL